MTSTTAIVKAADQHSQPTGVAVRGIRIDNIDDLQRFCKAAAASGFFKDARELAQAMVKVQYGLELGIGPIAAMQGVHCIEGKLCIGANLIAGRIKNSGRYDYRIPRHDEMVCTIDFYEQGQKVGSSTFTMQDAKRAGVDGRANWKNYPRNMLFSRAVSNGARWYTPDIFAGPVYTPDEIGDGVMVEDEIGRDDPPTPVAPVEAKKPAPAVDAPTGQQPLIDDDTDKR